MSLAKREVAEAILARAALHVHLDPRRPGVVVPAHLASQPSLILAVGRTGMQVPIPDLVVDDDGVRGTLSFGGRPFACTVPWSAVFALVDPSSKGRVFSEDVPPDLPRPPRHEEECSFCLVTRADARWLVSAQDASICEACVRRYRRRGILDVLREWLVGRPRTRGDVVRMPYRDAPREGCSFCGETARPTVVGARARICAPCIERAFDVVRTR